MYLVDSPKRQEEAMNTMRQSPSSIGEVTLVHSDLISAELAVYCVIRRLLRIGRAWKEPGRVQVSCLLSVRASSASAFWKKEIAVEERVREVLWFILRTDRDMGPTSTDDLTSSPKDNWWFIGAQLGAGVIDSQDHKNGTMAKDVALLWDMHVAKRKGLV